MAKEIEHKYLVIDNSYKSMTAESYRISQGYISTEKERTVRIRIIGNEARLTIKGMTVGDTRSEYEYSIPVSDADEMLKNLCVQPIIEKTRHIVNFRGNKWEIDEFGGKLNGLVVAEIEIPYSEYKYDIPPFAGKNVTMDSRYYNSNLKDTIPVG